MTSIETVTGTPASEQRRHSRAVQQPPNQSPEAESTHMNVIPSTPTPTTKWWKRKRIFIPALIVVGVAIGSSAGKNEPADAVDTTATTEAPVVTEAPTPVVTEAPTPVVTEAPAPVVTEAPAPVVTEAPAPVETMGQQNARRKAESYLSFMAFSFDGLVEQLEYEGFSTDDATYGAFAVDADWNEQAQLKAASYLDSMAFSHDGLVDQLVYEGFTLAQAEYGVAAVGL
jgi:hypothetical protein